MNKEFKNKVLDILKEKEISPKPKWQFLLKDYFVWISAILAILVGGIATSITIFTFANSDWESYQYLSGGLLEHLINTAPFFWTVFLAIFILITDFNFTHTKKGYKYSTPKVVGLTILISLILGFVFYQVGLAHIADYELGRYLPRYQKFTEKRQQLWNRPTEGLLSGTVVLSERSGSLILKDFNGKEWSILTDKLMPIHFIILDNIDSVSFIGDVINDNTFEACDVRPWHIKGESNYLREKIHNKMIEAGIKFHLRKDGINNIRRKFKEENLNERNIFSLRNNMCEGE